MTRLKLKPPNKERQKAFLQEIDNDLAHDRARQIEWDCHMNEDWLEFITDPKRKIKKERYYLTPFQIQSDIYLTLIHKNNLT